MGDVWYEAWKRFCDETGKKVKVKAFHLETTDEWHPAKDYVAAPQFNIRIDPKSIAAEPAPAK